MTIKTRLVLPSRDPDDRPGITSDATPRESESPTVVGSNKGDELSHNHLNQHNGQMQAKPDTNRMVVRIEVTDTGCGALLSRIYASGALNAYL